MDTQSMVKVLEKDISSDVQIDSSSDNSKSETEQTSDIKFGIGKRLILAFGIVAAMTILVSAISWYNLTKLSNTQTALTEESVPAVK
ncbi:MCP four helix bundle domain-containing protein [Kiloniella sp.]|uniref:MCP four helix bundle domain-containing protein n=1 Tax=Kiloniella sp. TaxID=1938587 RepID=UPI003B0259CA